MTEHPGQWGSQGGYSASGAWQLSASTTRGISASAACRLSASAGIPASATGRRGLSAAEGLCTPAASWWISASAARGLWTSGPSSWGPWIPGRTSQEESGNDHRDRRCGNRALAAVGGIIMVLTRGGGGEQPNVTITPSQPVPPTEEPTAEPTGQPTTQEPQPTPTGTSQPPPGGSLNLGNGIELTPANGWEVKKTGKNVAQLSDGESVFLGQSLQISQSTNPAQLCDAWHRNVAEGTSNGKFQDPEDAEVGTTRLKAATCVAEVTVSGGQGTTKLFLFSLASVRQSDGVTVIGTAYFRPKCGHCSA